MKSPQVADSTSIVKKSSFLAEYLTAQIGLRGKSQLDIARECNFEKPNMITMIKQGKSKLPISRVGLMAKALGIDPMHLFMLAMSEYEPETWKVIQGSILKQPAVTANEMEIIEVVRGANVVDPKIRTDEEKNRLLDVINTLKPMNALADD